MKIQIIFLLVLIVITGGCRKATQAKPSDLDVLIWVKPGKNGLKYSIGHTPISSKELNLIMEKVTNNWETTASGQICFDKKLVIQADPQLSITNLLPALMLADQYRITNVVVRLWQVQPPPVHNEPGYIE